ncbi:MAG: autotransporter outer membrane beta-barrel domain-containing protein, partial [Planctomycetaceae bacterium]|nr:autotransporter outer membrane beta-barrel domain-containing protein [Planctomycetaceae bacterium]
MKPLAPEGTVALTLNGSPILGNNAITDSTTNEKVFSLTRFTEYKLNKDETAYIAHHRKRVNLSDGFLLPASIHRYNTAWDATRDHLIDSRQHGLSNKCEDAACNPCEPCSSKGKTGRRNAWVNYVGRNNSYRSSYSNNEIENGDWEIATNGIQVGLDLYKKTNTQFGLLFGYEDSKATLYFDRLEANDVYFGGYIAYVFRNNVDFRAVYNYGSQDYKLNRFDPGLGFGWNSHNSDFDGNTHELNLEFGKRFFVNRRWSYRPVIGFDLFVNNWNATLENGNPSTAIAYGNTDYTQAFLRIGSDLKFVKNRFVFNSGLYYSYDVNDNDLKTKVFARNDSELGYDKAINSTLYGSRLGRSVLTFNLGGSIALNKKCSV